MLEDGRLGKLLHIEGNFNGPSVYRFPKEHWRPSREEGPAGGLDFWGGSFVSDPGGRVIAKAGGGEEVLTATLDLGKVDSSRTHWPFLRDRRIDAYADITKRYLD